MRPRKQTPTVLEDVRVNPKLKIAALWTGFMFLYIYVDYFHLYMPGALDEILEGRVFLFDINQAFVFTGLASVILPALMIFLSVALPAELNRWVNMIVAAVYIPYSLFNLLGVAWVHMYFAAAIEVVMLLLIIRSAWTWPRRAVVAG